MAKEQEALEHMENCKYENGCKNCKMKLDCTFEEDHKLLQECINEKAKLKEILNIIKRTCMRLQLLGYTDIKYFDNDVEFNKYLTEEEFDKIKEWWKNES